MLGILGLNKWLLGGAAAILIALGGWVGVTKYQLSQARNTVLTQQATITTLTVNVKTAETMIALKDKELAAANTRHVEELAEAEKVCKQLKEIDDAPETDNGKPGKILKRTIEGL